MPRLLTLNAGSSSLRSSVYDAGSFDAPLVTAQVSRIGREASRMEVLGPGEESLLEEETAVRDHLAACRRWFAWLQSRCFGDDIVAVGHRLVYGGLEFAQPQPITDALLDSLAALTPLDPEHMPQALAVVRFVREALPAVPQVACFDTAFHRDMPAVAQRYALPRRYTDAGIIRFGFHGLSYEYIIQELRRLDPVAAHGRVLIAHLGNGASMAAVRDGVCVDTTMGFTPAGGLVMSTRTGDLDPGVIVHLLRSYGPGPEALSRLINSESGLLGVSGMSGDMADLLKDEASRPEAAEAVALFCYQARKFAGALAAALGGLDTLVFTAGIGENAPPVRDRVCEGLGFLGLDIEHELNQQNAAIVSSPRSRVVVRVMKTDEDQMIARHTSRLISRGDRNASV